MKEKFNQNSKNFEMRANEGQLIFSTNNQV